LRNEPDKVVGVYQIALKFDPEFVPSLMNLGKIMIGEGKIVQGLGLLQRASRLAPADPIVASDLAIAYAMTGRPEPAERILLRLLEQDPDTPGTRLNLGRLYFQSSRFTEAAVQLREHLKTEPDSVEALSLLCWVLVSSPGDSDRDPRLAREFLNRLVRQESRESARSHDLRAAIHAELGDFDSAVAAARQAVRLAGEQRNPSAAEIQQRLKLYLNRQPYRLR
jgi:Flp pilus assembly protein TadD